MVNIIKLGFLNTWDFASGGEYLFCQKLFFVHLEVF